MGREGVDPDLAAAREAVQELLAALPDWAITLSEGRLEGRLWVVLAYDFRSVRRYAKRRTIEGTGRTEAAALLDLAAKLRRVNPVPSGEAPRPHVPRSGWT